MRVDAAGPRQVLIYSMGEVIGDGLIKLPFMAAARAAFPDAYLAWCAGGGETVYRTALKGLADRLVDQVLVQPSRPGVLDFMLPRSPFDGGRFDLVIDTQSNVPRSLYIRRAARTFISPAAGFRLSHRRPAAWPTALVSRLETLLTLAAGRPTPLRPVELVGSRAGDAAAHLLPSGPVYVGFAPGAGGADKRWPLDRYIALADLQRRVGRTPVFFFGPEDAAAEVAVGAAIPEAVFPERDRGDPFVEVRGPLLVIALASRLAAAVANDAGPGHMLAAGGAPLLSLQKDRRMAEKFFPAATRLKMLVAEDFGSGMQALPVAQAAMKLDQLIMAGAA